MFNDFIHEEIIKRSIQKAKYDLENEHRNLREVPEEILKKMINEKFATLNFSQSQSSKPNILFVDKVKLTKVILEEKRYSRNKPTIE